MRHRQFVAATTGLVAALAMIASPSIANAEVPETDTPARPPGVTVLVAFSDVGDYSWSSTISGFSPGSQYTLNYKRSYRTTSGGGGDFQSQIGGVIYTGATGSGTSGVRTGSLGTTATSVTITVTVGGITASDTDAC